MTTEQLTSLEQFKERFNEVKQVQDNNLKSIRLSALMTDLESVYEIPQTGHLRIAAFKQAYPGIVTLYKQVSEEGGF